MAGLNDAKPSSKAFVRKLLAMHDGDLESALPEGVRRLKSSHGAVVRHGFETPGCACSGGQG
jgi:hypothetical protein